VPHQPLVSILINNHNYGRFLDAAIRSALDQSYEQIEVIVVDDGSTDDSRAILERYGRSIAAILTPHLGQGSAYNEGFAASRGELICFLDSDDVYAPNKVDEIVKVFEQFPQAGWLRHKLELVDGGLRPIGVRIPHYRGSRLELVKKGMALEHRIRFVISSGMVLRRRTAAMVLPIPESVLSDWQLGADSYVGFWSTAIAPCYSLDRVLTLYRRQDSQRLAGRKNLITFLDRCIRFDERLSEMWSDRVGSRRVASDVYKFTLALTGLQGVPRWAPERRRAFQTGLRAVAPLLGAYPSIALRQAVAMSIVFVVPEIWNRRLAQRVAIVH
jgi:glycosyltransferase involved in cell wall biosynthesis